MKFKNTKQYVVINNLLGSVKNPIYYSDTAFQRHLLFRSHNLTDYETYKIGETYTTLNFIEKIINKQSDELNIIYYFNKLKAMNIAQAFTDKLNPLSNSVFNKMNNRIRDKIHNDYYLVDLITKGVAYHPDYLPFHTITKISEFYRKRMIKTILCTSSLIEKLNLPANNLIFINRCMDSEEINQIEFRNLIDRVERSQYNLYGNVLTIRDNQISVKKTELFLVKLVEDQNLALVTQLIGTKKKYIADQFLLKGVFQLNMLYSQKKDIALNVKLA